MRSYQSLILWTLLFGSWSAEASFSYKSLGCYFDKNVPRAIPSLEKKCDLLDGKYFTRDDAIQKCFECANSNGFEIFAISKNGECLSSENAMGNYMLHGPSTNCNDEGTGGDLKNKRSMDVYKIVQDCVLANKCRLVDLNGVDDSTSGRYRSIQKCINEANAGDTCLIRSGRYREEIKINGAANLTIKGDPEQKDPPIIDGTVELKRKSGGAWGKRIVNGNTVCMGKINVENGKHPFQLFLKHKGELTMMTNARWPNARWIDRDPVDDVPLVFYNDFWGKSATYSERGLMIDAKNANNISPLAESGLDMKDAMAVLNTGSWQTFVKPVQDHSAGADRFTYDDDFGNIHFTPQNGKGQYYIDSKENLLDNPGEWFYNMDDNMLKFMPFDGKDECPEPNSGSVFGRVFDYGIEVSEAHGLYVSNINFFASNMYAVATRTNKPEIDEIHLDTLKFEFPSSSKRMLKDPSVPLITKIAGKPNGKVSIINCEFMGAEGSALQWWGKEAEVKNNLFKWIDWSGQMWTKAAGGFGTVQGNKDGYHETFERNTLWHNGAETGLRAGRKSNVLKNLVIGQAKGKILNDGSCLQFQTGATYDALVQENWALDSSRLGIRFDNVIGTPGGRDGTMDKNVVWKTDGIMVKGRHHNITGNLALENNGETAAVLASDKSFLALPSLQVVNMLRGDTIVHNEDSIVERNAAVRADGGLNKFEQCSTKNLYGRWQLAGFKRENYYANTSWYCEDGYDGSWALDGQRVFPDADLPDLLMDIDDYDFRPKPDTVLTNQGFQVGPYAAANSDATTYTIPGRQEDIPSFPIPSYDPKHEKIIPRKDALMFQPAFRCTGENDKHLVYIAKDNQKFPILSKPTVELSGEENMVILRDLKMNIDSGKLYKWRVDCLEGQPRYKRRTGDVWKFTMTD